MGTLYNSGRSRLFDNGWVSYIDKAYLYTSSDVKVAEADVSFVYSGGVLVPTADIVFSVAAGVNNVAYVIIGELSGGGILLEFYKEEFSTTYNFSTAGTFTIDSWEINCAGTYLQAAGEQALFETGWGTTITKAKLYTSGDVLVDTQTVDFDVNGSFQLVLDATCVFDVTSATSGINYITLCKTDDTVLYKRIFSTPSTYDFTTPGTLSVTSWVFSL